MPRGWGEAAEEENTACSITGRWQEGATLGSGITGECSCPHILQHLPHPSPLSFSPWTSGMRPASADLPTLTSSPPSPLHAHLAHDNALDLGKHAPGLQLKADEGGRVVDVE